MARSTPWLVGGSALGILSGAALWTVGRVATPPPDALRALLGLTVAAGAGLTAGAGWAGASRSGVRRFAFWVAAADVAAAAGFVASVFYLPEGPVPIVHRVPPPAGSPATLTLLDWNVLHGYPRLADQEGRYRRSAAALAALDADVLVLQEAWSTARHGRFVDRLGGELGLDAAYARANGSLARIGFEEGLAVLSRYPILSARRLRLVPRDPWQEARIALFVRLDLGGGERLDVVDLHLANRSPRVAAAQAADLASRLPAQPPRLVAGDFNAKSGSPGLAPFLERGWRDLLPGGIDHLLVPAEGLPYVPRSVRWALRPPKAAPPSGRPVEFSDHPAILVELERRRP